MTIPTSRYSATHIFLACPLSTEKGRRERTPREADSGRLDRKRRKNTSKTAVFKGWWWGMDSNHRTHRGQIYSLLRLATSLPHRGLFGLTRHGGAEGIRTLDPYVANVMLYQLSYRPKRRPRQIVEGGTYQPPGRGARIFTGRLRHPHVPGILAAFCPPIQPGLKKSECSGPPCPPRSVPWCKTPVPCRPATGPQRSPPVRTPRG